MKPAILHAVDPGMRLYGDGRFPWCGQGGFDMRFARRWRSVTCKRCRAKGRPRRVRVWR